MPSKTPFFNGMSRVLFGRPPVSQLQKLARSRGEIEQLCPSQFKLLFGGFIPVALFDFRLQGQIGKEQPLCRCAILVTTNVLRISTSEAGGCPLQSEMEIDRERLGEEIAVL